MQPCGKPARRVDAPVGVGVSAELPHEEMLQEGIHIKCRGVAAFRVCGVGPVDLCLHAVEGVFDVVILLWRNGVLVRFLECRTAIW